MIYENDKLNIPEEYRKMSVPELRKEKERVLKQFTRKTVSSNARKRTEGKKVIFN